jgi:D-xylose transport system ATP-binding protein
LNSNPFVETRNITKEFPGVRALDGIDFRVHPGEILGLVGENGAGKSTLMRIFGGVYPHGTYGGDLLVNGESVRFQSPLDAESAGIAIIHQELSTFSHLSVAENIFVGHWPLQGLFVDWETMFSEAEKWLKAVGARCSSQDLMGNLSVGTQQLVEIAKALSRQSRVLILDEPTSALSKKETDNLFELLFRLRAERKGLIYISHKMEEVFKLCDRLVVLRDGRSVHETPAKAIQELALIGHMVGRPLTKLFPERLRAAGPDRSLLSVSNLAVRDRGGHLVVSDVSFDVKSGEIFGLAGLLGSGRSETLHALFGDDSLSVTGTVRIQGQEGIPGSPQEALCRGLSLVPEDRKRQSIFPRRSLDENLSQTRLALTPLFSVINEDFEEKNNRESLKSFRVKTTSSARHIDTLSGGNQQKIVLGRILQAKPQVILLDEPTRGVDVGAKYEIYEILFALARAGHALVVVSSELPELLGLCDRIGVLHQGKLDKIFDKSGFDQQQIMRFAVGAK